MSLTPSIPNSPSPSSPNQNSPKQCSPTSGFAEEGSAGHSPDRLMQELERCEAGLNAWLGLSAANAHWLVRDPVGALRAANLGLDEQILLELDATMKMIAKKIGDDLCALGTPNCA